MSHRGKMRALQGEIEQLHSLTPAPNPGLGALGMGNVLQGMGRARPELRRIVSWFTFCVPTTQNSRQLPAEQPNLRMKLVLNPFPSSQSFPVTHSQWIPSGMTKALGALCASLGQGHSSSSSLWGHRGGTWPGMRQS